MGNINTFYEEQPPLLFIDELKSPIHKEKPSWFNRTEKEAGEVFVKGIHIINNFPDEEGLLQTATDDFKLFSKVYGIGGEDYPVYLEFGKTSKFEEYIISVKEDCATIKAEDTEGIRRGIIFLEDELKRRDGAFLPLGEIKKTPRIKARITSGFFSPTNRPPKNIDELMNDVDYYPDEYLNRLAHDGTNGLWIYTRLTDLVKTDIIPEYGKDSETRIAKLKSIVKRCKRYGVGVYPLFIAPEAMTGEIAKNHPELVGASSGGVEFAVCPSSEKGAAYYTGAIEQLCNDVPDLAGIICVSFGERKTTCASYEVINCPRCKDLSRPQIVAKGANLMRKGMRNAEFKGDLICFTYGYRRWSVEESQEFVRCIDSDIITLDSFEEQGVNNQLGKDRLAIDYWLSYTGPSEIFKKTMEAARSENKSMYAKMQVCCSHEVATLPYIAVPGILFDKFSQDIQGVMECWYFGNYPSMMSKAAGELAFWYDFDDKNKFLEHLAGMYCGRESVKRLVEAFRFFEEGYSNYPTNIVFSYYGPMHDGVCWELFLEPKNTTLARTWLYLDTPDGDRIYDCMRKGHTIDEVHLLLSGMKENWQKGIEIMPDDLPDEMKIVINAMFVLIKSSSNIINFYRLRFLLNDSENKMNMLNILENIVRAEMENSKEMMELCEKDSRLGYHPEAENYKFFPAQLKKRIKSLEFLIKTEFEAVKKRIEDGKEPLCWDVGYGEITYKLTRSEETAKREQINDVDAYFKLWEDDEKFYFVIDGKKDGYYFIGFENQLFTPTSDIFFYQGKASMGDLYSGLIKEKRDEEVKKYEYSCERKEDREIYRISVKKEDVDVSDKYPLRLRISANNRQWSHVEFKKRRLAQAGLPGEYGRLIR